MESRIGTCSRCHGDDIEVFAFQDSYVCEGCAQAILSAALEKTEAVQVGRILVRGLPPQQARAVGHVVLGDTSKQAAKAMGVSPRTVESYVNAAMEKLGAKNRANLITLAFGTGVASFAEGYCGDCGNHVADHAMMTEVNPPGGYGRPQVLICDTCMHSGRWNHWITEHWPNWPELPRATYPRAELSRNP